MMPFITDEEGIERWQFTQPDDCDHLGRANHDDHRCRWHCVDCGWAWPVPGTPPDGAECDNCGGEMEA